MALSANCTLAGCEKQEQVARGLCSRCYRRYRSHLAYEKRLRSHPPTGWCYLVEAGGYFKLGHTAHLEQRISAIDHALPFEARLIHAIEALCPSAVEYALKRRFWNKRVRGEWFVLTEEDVRHIRTLKVDDLLYGETAHERAMRLTQDEIVST